MSARGPRHAIGGARSETLARLLASSSLEERGLARGQVAEIQRSRLLAATIAAVQQVGYERTTVAEITGRARVSRRTFYELFANREECIAAVLRSVAARVRSELEAAGLSDLTWRERMRQGLWLVLCFLDREPALARVVVLETLRGSGPVSAEREAIVSGLVALVDEGRREKAGAGRSELTAEGVLGATLAIVSRDLARGERREPLALLHPELLGIVLLPYLGPAVACREQARPAPALPATTGTAPELPVSLGVDALAGLQMRLTYRTARVLEGVAKHAGASNRQVADYAGIADQGQVSKLLARLERLGLLANAGAGQLKGEPNAWQLTPRGRLVTQSIRLHTSRKQVASS
jgi:AcrR family transcriptional regulator